MCCDTVDAKNPAPHGIHKPLVNNNLFTISTGEPDFEPSTKTFWWCIKIWYLFSISLQWPPPSVWLMHSSQTSPIPNCASHESLRLNSSEVNLHDLGGRHAWFLGKLRGFWRDSIKKTQFKVTSAEVVTIGPYENGVLFFCWFWGEDVSFRF